MTEGSQDPAERPQPDIDRELVRGGLAQKLFGGSPQPVRLGRFQVLRRLGQGAMGAVYEALDEQQGSRVAIKVLGRFDGKAIYRLKREFRSLSGVVHPNLIVLHELFIEPAHHFFSMELVEGVPFDAWVRPSGETCDEARLRDALRQLAVAVHQIHAAGKLHCDLKPSNVLVTPAGRLVVLDFGLVGEWGTAAAANWLQSEVAGTPAYLAPEQAGGAAASPASDWYAVGVMLFEALTGRLPFEGNPLRILSDKQTQQPPDPRAFAAELPQDLSDLSMRLLRGDPEQRAGFEQALAVVSADRAARQEAQADVPSRSVFVGREHELAQLDEGLRAAREGRPACVLLPGRSGMGKSAILERFAEVAARSALVLRGRCHEQESVPYKVFDGVVDALSQYLKELPDGEVTPLLPRRLPALLQLFPVLGRAPGLARAAAEQRRMADARDLRNQAFAALKELLLRLTDRGTVVIMVDDLQWGDVDSAHMLTSLLAPPESPPLLFVGAYRSDDVDGEFLRVLLKDPADARWQQRVVEVGPLPREAAAELARELLPAGAEHAERIAAEADGVPFFVAELARFGARKQPSVERRVSLERVILDRAASLPAEAQRLLRVLSVTAGPLEYAVAFDAAQIPATDRASLLALRNARLIRTGSGAASDLAETYHDRVRETIVGDMSDAAICSTHGLIARAMERHGIADVERLVVHYGGAGDLIAAGTTAVAAAHAAAHKLAFNRAAALFQKAIELLPDDQSVELLLYRHLGEALANAGQGAKAALAYLAAARSLKPPAATRMASLAALQYWLGGKTEEALALTRSVFRTVGIELPAERQANWLRIAWQRVRLRARGYELSQTAPLSEERRERLEALFDLAQPLNLAEPGNGALLEALYLREALDSGDPRHALMALMWEVTVLSMYGGAANERKAARMMSQLAALAERIDTPYARYLLHFADALRLLAAGHNFRDAGVFALKAQEFAEQCAGTFWERGLSTYIYMFCLRMTGSLRELAQRANENMRDANERDDQFIARFAVSSVGYSLLMRDQPRAAREFLEQRRSSLGTHYTGFRHLWSLAMTNVLIYEGAAHEAVALLEREWALLTRSLYYASQFVRETGQCHLALAALASHYQHPSPDSLQLARRALARLTGDSRVYGVLRTALLAALDTADGPHERAVATLQASVTLFHECQAPLMALYTSRYLALLHGNQGAVEAADSELRAQGVLNPRRWAWTHFPTPREV